MGQQLQLIDWSNDGTEFAGATPTITAARSAAGGDGLVNVGRINATGIDLLNVVVDGDLGRIQAGSIQSRISGP